MQILCGHCRGGESIASPPTIQVARDAHDLSDALELPRRELCWQFDPHVRIHGAQIHASQKDPINMTDFWFALPLFFRSQRIFPFPLCSATSARCRTRRSMIPRLWWLFPRINRCALRLSSQRNTSLHNLCSGVSSFGTVLAQTFFISKYSIKIVWTDDFPKPSSSAIILTVNQWSLSTR